MNKVVENKDVGFYPALPFILSSLEQVTYPFFMVSLSVKCE